MRQKVVRQRQCRSAHSAHKAELHSTKAASKRRENAPVSKDVDVYIRDEEEIFSSGESEIVASSDVSCSESDISSAEGSAQSSGGSSTSYASRAVVFFDWDDTLLPSSWLSNNALTVDRACEVPHEVWPELVDMAQRAQATLLTAMEHSTVVIVTNAEHGWIELSCTKFMPSLKPLLSKIRQLSARTAYEAESTTPFDWKKLAFRHVLHDHCQQLDANESLNAISFGDSLHERVAILSLAK
eukprot:GHVU01016654.1.p1 GENE.GHVU01016654.1~~GHVU01016654.1.p1  ORF type:complete len:241 (-),score=24.59 GHVU01016654.1:445-1167(-)